MAINIIDLMNTIHDNAETDFAECMDLIRESANLAPLDAKVMLVRATNLAATLEIGYPAINDDNNSPRLRVYNKILEAYKAKGMEMNEGLAVAEKALELIPLLI